MMDSAISLSITLFILSMINERIANFIKLKFSDKKVIGFQFRNLKLKTAGDEEDDRVRRIIGINIVCGTIISLCLRADLITILSHVDQPSNGIGWDKPILWWNWITLPIGCFLTGCFLSLGSKFWHDLLDLLLYTKNLKEKLVDERTYEDPTSVDQIEEFILTPEYKLAQLAIDKYAFLFRSMPGLLSIGAGYLNRGINKVGCIEIHVSAIFDGTHVQDQYMIELSTGRKVNIPLKKVVTGAMPKVNTVMASGQVANETHALGSGTIGAIVKDKAGTSNYILSCFHVLNGNNNWKSISDEKGIVAEQNGSQAEVATLTYGFRTNDMDAAIAQIKPGVTFSNSVIKNPKGTRDVKSIDAIHEVKVSVYGNVTSPPESGAFLYNDSWAATFLYPDNSTWRLDDLIVLTKIDVGNNSYKSITKGGDSGAMVLDDKDVVIGMIIGADDNFSYAMKINKIITALDVSF